MSEYKNNNKSLFMYTALIFITAIILIIIAFFGQENVHKNQPSVQSSIEPSKQLSSSISERAAVLSDENAVLLKENQELEAENDKIKKELDTLKEKDLSDEKLLEAYSLMSNNDKENALLKLSEINIEKLNENQKILYNKINEQCSQ